MKIPRRKTPASAHNDEDPPPWVPQFTKDANGFVVEPKWWTAIDTYPALDEKVRSVRVYRTKHDEYIPLQYSLVTTSRYDRSYAWPAVVAIRNELRIRFGQTNSIRFGIRPDEESKVSEWRKVGDFPDFREQHVHRGNPDFVVMSSDWVPVIRGRATTSRR